MTSHNLISFATIGTSWITHSFIASAQSTSLWNLRAIYSRSQSSGKSFAEKYPENKDVAIHTDLEALAKDESFSTVYIASPNSLHYEHAKRMLEAGKNVVLEKPAVTNKKQLAELFDIAQEKNVVLVEAFRHLHEPNFKTFKAAVEEKLNGSSGEGNIYGANLSYAQYSSRYDAVLAGETPNIFNLDFAGGALVDLGVYCIAAAIDIFGEPQSSQYFPVVVRTGADGGGTLVLRYERGFTVTITASKIFSSEAPSEVYGKSGTLSIPTITDIASVGFTASSGPGKGKKEELGGKQVDKELNLADEAKEFARIIKEGDKEAVERWKKVSEGVVGVTEKVRRESGLLFPGERDTGEGKSGEQRKGEVTTGIIGGV